MQTKLQELTEKIYQEGVHKANEEAEKIVADARQQAQHILANAKKEAQSIIGQAEKEAKETKKNAINELQLSGRQVISDIKQKVVGLIEAKTIKPETKAAFKDKDFILDMIRTIVKNWDPRSGDAVTLDLVLPKEQEKELIGYFTGKSGELLGKGLEVSFSDKMKEGFKIGPKEGGYLVSFSDDGFENLFQEYLRPKLIELLFQNQHTGTSS